MKLSNLSLAILVALGTAACGGSGSSSSNSQPTDPQTPSNPVTPTPTPTPTDDTSALVDPTKTNVVDNKILSTQETVGTLQYIRREGSSYDRNYNPSNPASASPYLGVSLDVQNPKLTNIILARQDLVKTNGEPVKAQFAGGTAQEPLTLAGAPNPGLVGPNLQTENYVNVDVLAGAFAPTNTTGAYTADTSVKSGVFNRTSVNAIDTSALTADHASEIFNRKTGNYELLDDNKLKEADLLGTSTPVTVPTTVTAVRENLKPVTNAGVEKYGSISLYKQYKPNSNADAGIGVIAASDIASITNGKRRYGSNLIWWSAPNDAFENDVTRSGGVAGTDGQDATTGLVRIGGGIETLGQELNWNGTNKVWEDHHNTTTRIFGRYHLAYANADKSHVDPVTLNTFVGASSFISEVEVPAGATPYVVAADAINAGNTKAKSYSIGAVPGHLENVQYGRVTTNLDLDLDATTYGDGFMHSLYLAKNNDGSVDNYFYRGTNATTVAEMAALPTDKKLVYHGHALMYGIDNNYHASGSNNLPNAFAYGSDGLGLGNFVEATADLATKKLTGTVYNAWLLDQSKATITKDVLVNFSGNIVGNSAFGSADRAYIAGEDKADFRASFFGDKAEELGGSFNSVHSIPANGTPQSYGSAYGTGDWGGVFGAKQAGSGNTFQGDDGANVYTGLSN